MAYKIGRNYKLEKKKRKYIENTTNPYSSPSIHSYSCNRLIENTDSNTTIVLPPNVDTSIQTQHNSAADASAGANYVSSSGLDQSTNHHCNTDIKNYYYFQSYEKPHKNTVPTLLVIQYQP